MRGGFGTAEVAGEYLRLESRTIGKSLDTASPWFCQLSCRYTLDGLTYLLDEPVDTVDNIGLAIHDIYFGPLTDVVFVVGVV